MAEQKPQVIDGGTPSSPGGGTVPAGKKGGKRGDRRADAEAARAEGAPDGTLVEGGRAGRGDGKALKAVPPKVDYDKIQAEREQKAHPGFFHIYKKGQGYWTRMGTGLSALLVAALTTHFIYQQVGVWLRTAPERVTMEETVNGVRTTVGTLHEVSINATPLALTVALIVLFAALGSPLGKLMSWLVAIGAFVAARVALGQGMMDTTYGTAPGLPATVPSLLYTEVAAAAAAAFLLFFGVWVWRLMNKPSNVDFLIATDSEMKKVNWTTRAELVGSTKVVIFFMILIAVLLFVIDTIFGYLFYLIKVLQVGPFGS